MHASHDTEGTNQSFVSAFWERCELMKSYTVVDVTHCGAQRLGAGGLGRWSHRCGLSMCLK